MGEPSNTPRRIVLLEEDEAIRIPLARGLRDAGFEVCEADGAEDAVKELERGDVASLVADYHHRTASGEGLFRWTRQQHPGCVVVMVTSPSDLHIAVDALAARTIERFALQTWDPLEICRSVTLAVGGRSVPAHNPQPSAKPRGTVLVIDDNDLVRPALAKTLVRHDYRCVEATDGAEALHLADGEPFAVALVDIVIPKVDGADVIRYLKAHHPSCVAVAMSGLTNPDARDEAFAAGADDFLPKPVKPPVLLERVEGYMRMHEVRAGTRQDAARSEQLELYAREMSSLLAHDLRNGFAAVESSLEFIERAGDLDEELLEALHDARRALRRMTTLASNLTDVNLLERGSFSAERKPVDVAALVRAVIEVHRSAVRAEDAAFEIDAPRSLVASVDPTLVERILHNLLNNAVRFVDDGGTVRVRARMREDDDPPTLVVEVGNTGATLPPEIRAGVFRPGGKKGSRARTGLGLYFCRMACQAHGGTIAVTPDAPYEANFSIRLPTR